MSDYGEDNSLTRSDSGKEILNQEKRKWIAPSLTMFPTHKSEGKDVFNADEGTDTSGPS